MGFQENEIDMLRVQFHEFHRTFGHDELLLHLDEARVVEDHWIFSNVREDRLSREPHLSLFEPISHGSLLIGPVGRSIDQDTEFYSLPVPPEGNYWDLVIGLLLGFLCGLMILPFLYEKQFNLRQQMGIVAGLFVNLIFGIIKLSY
jgi:hypothetical protein